MATPWRVIDLIEWAESYFEKKSFEKPRAEIEWLLCSLLDCERLDLYLRYDEPLSKSQLETLRGWVKRRLTKEPLQYITGACEFYGREFIITPDVLIPRPETERLIDIALTRLNAVKSPKILDIGTGSGCIAITMAKERPDAKVVGVDNSIKALMIAERNSIHLEVTEYSFIEMNILKSTPKGMFDLLISNPPYISKKEIPELMKDVIGFEPESALTDYSDGLTFYKRFSEIAPKIVHNNSLLILEVGLKEHPQKVYDIFFDQGYTSIEIIKDYNGDDRVMVVQV